MKYLSEYRDPKLARTLVQRIRATATRRWTLMEVCGGQTHTIVKQGIHDVLSEAVEMIHGPGCPVCVTPLVQIDRALHLAGRPDVIFTSFGDMLRVPGSDCDLFQVRARGGNVRIVYSPLDAVQLAPAAHTCPQTPQLSGSKSRSRHTPLHRLWPTGHWQAPSTQRLPPVHRLPQAPQWFASLSSAVSQPLDGSPSQLP